MTNPTYIAKLDLADVGALRLALLSYRAACEAEAQTMDGWAREQPTDELATKCLANAGASRRFAQRAGELLDKLDLDKLDQVAAPAPIEPSDYEEEPEEQRTGLYRVRFFMLTTTCDRHSIAVRASSPEAAKARVEAGKRGLIDLTDDEIVTERLDKEMDVTDSAFDGLAREPWDAPTELETPEIADATLAEKDYWRDAAAYGPPPSWR